MDSSMNIAFVNGKGGSGKTTSAILVALALREAGHRAVVRDLDPQKTATRWLSDTPELLANEGDIVLTDTAPRLETAPITQAINTADAVVVVSRPSPCDLFTSQDTSALIDRLNAKGKSRLLFTSVRENTILGRDLDETAKDIGLKPLKAYFQLRECYQHAVLAGWKALTPEAREEAGRVALAIVALGR